jgi:hypothetical protein
MAISEVMGVGATSELEQITIGPSKDLYSRLQKSGPKEAAKAILDCTATGSKLVFTKLRAMKCCLFALLEIQNEPNQSGGEMSSADSNRSMSGPRR